MKKLVFCAFFLLLGRSAFTQCIDYYSTAARHSAAVVDGAMWVWGSNDYGELGTGGTEVHYTPIKLIDDENWSKVFAGISTTFGIKNNGTLWACGSGTYGRLGLGDQQSHHTFTQVGSSTDWTFVTSSGATLAIKSDGTLWGWGDPSFGQLNREPISFVFFPEQLTPENDWVQVAVGYWHTVALKNNGTLWACGRNNKGQLGDGTTQDRHVFFQVGTDTDWVQISAYKESTMALKADGTIWGWGSNASEFFGIAQPPYSINSPTQINPDTDWESITAGEYYGIAKKTDGRLFQSQATGWIQIDPGNDWLNVDIGTDHYLALKSDFTLWGKGNNSVGELGMGSGNNNVPVLTQLPCPVFLAIPEFAEENIILYPNPTSDILNISNTSLSEIIEIVISDISGKAIYRTFEKNQIDMTAFEAGIYIITVLAKNSSHKIKVVKQ